MRVRWSVMWIDPADDIHDLRHLIHEPGPNNDLIDNTRKLPRLERIARSDFPRAITALKGSQPVVEFIRPYIPDFIGWLRDFGQSTSNYDANGHFARIQPIFNVFSLNGNVLTPLGNNNRLDGLQTGNLARCPGAASQKAVDNSAPFLDTANFDCNPNQIPPGP